MRKKQFVIGKMIVIAILMIMASMNGVVFANENEFYKWKSRYF